jgi:hypothetical protein
MLEVEGLLRSEASKIYQLHAVASYFQKARSLTLVLQVDEECASTDTYVLVVTSISMVAFVNLILRKPYMIYERCRCFSAEP